ncbi:spore cortex biosynthesis protein YabQ [Paenibacillus anaericanus]|uniref:Spore cortex biosynthesis protein YabQ n=1 Tax=Paenibacillus anaericanus TaxID=170367 RepID=A0A433Y3S6_9BACL|nr:spore cortex biosynthesis protein YabQ [Paenibacillus anaericanus]RUT42602.1 spore cortex biosynthesis protein YabQ [Paenibacillus anaericanus]
MNLQMQWATLLWMLFSGLIMGTAFDSYRVISGQLRFPRWSVHTLDLIYWIAASLFVFRNLYHSNHGELRFYVFLGLFIGVWAYFLFLSVITERFVVMLIRIVRQIYAITVRVVQILLIAPILWLLKLMKLLLGFVGIILLFLGRITLLPLWKLLIWTTRPIVKRLRIIDGFRYIQQRIIRIWQQWFGKN